jgi:hypothetical protein
MKGIFQFKKQKEYNSDEDLVLALMAVDMLAFEFFYKKYALKLFKIAYNQLGSQEDAEF